VFNVHGPEQPLTFEGLLATCRDVAGSDAEVVWADPEFLVEQGVEPWSDLPLWLPGEENAGFMQRSSRAAIDAGLRFRPVADTVRDTLAWDRERGLPPLQGGLSRDREAELLQAWRARVDDVR
jgi:2'-hydroxyisoflavone reductase